MGNEPNDFPIEYEHITSPDAYERLAEAYDLILDLILDELTKQSQDGNTCSTPSE